MQSNNQQRKGRGGCVRKIALIQMYLSLKIKFNGLNFYALAFSAKLQTVVDVCFPPGPKSILTSGLTMFTLPAVEKQQMRLFLVLRSCSIYLLTHCNLYYTFTVRSTTYFFLFTKQTFRPLHSLLCAMVHTLPLQYQPEQTMVFFISY